MSSRLSYSAEVPGNSSNGQRIVRFCMELARQHKWTTESFDLALAPDDSRVEGWFKFLSDPADVTDGMRDLLKAIEILGVGAKEFGLTWRVQLEDKEGVISPAECDTAVQEWKEWASGCIDEEQAILRRPRWRPEHQKRFSRRGIKALRDRWDEQSTLAVLEALFIEQKRPSPPFGFTPEDRFDARGINLNLLHANWPHLFTGNVGEVHSVPVLQNVDLAYSLADDKGPYVCVTWALAWRAKFINCVLDGVNAEMFLYGHYSNCSMRGMKVGDIHASLESCDCSFWTMPRYASGLPVQNCRFDHANFGRAKLIGTTFSKCSFRSAMLNSSELGDSKFIDCDFTDASFDNTFYGQTVFERCRGLDLQKMLDRSCVMMDIKLCEPKDIIIR